VPGREGTPAGCLAPGTGRCGPIFIPRARLLAERTGATWPAAYAQATVSYFERMLGAELGLEGSNNLA